MSRKANTKKTPITEVLLDLRADFVSLYAQMRALVDNRSAWSDGIEGGRATLALLGDASSKLLSVSEASQQSDSDLETARLEIKILSENLDASNVVEGQLRADGERCRAELMPTRTELARAKKDNARLLNQVKEQQAELEQLRATQTQQETALANTRALAKQLGEATGT